MISAIRRKCILLWLRNKPSKDMNKIQLGDANCMIEVEPARTKLTVKARKNYVVKT